MTHQPQTTQKLRLLLSQIAVKLGRKQPLTAAEQELLAECQRFKHMKPTERTEITSDGEIRVHRSVDAEPVMQAMKDYGDIIDNGRNNAAGVKMIGSIDPITASIWRTECGAGIGTREFAAYAKKKLADPNYKRFRFGGM